MILSAPPGCTLIGPKGELILDHGVIVAKRHIHMTPADAVTLKVKDNDEVFVLTKSFGRALIYADVVVRVDWSYRLAMHVDTDEANAFSNEKRALWGNRKNSLMITIIRINGLKTYCPVLTAKCQGILCDSILLLFTGDIPQGVFFEQSEQ